MNNKLSSKLALARHGGICSINPKQVKSKYLHNLYEFFDQIIFFSIGAYLTNKSVAHMIVHTWGFWLCTYLPVRTYLWFTHLNFKKCDSADQMWVRRIFFSRLLNKQPNKTIYRNTYRRSHWFSVKFFRKYPLIASFNSKIWINCKFFYLAAIILFRKSVFCRHYVLFHQQ